MYKKNSSEGAPFADIFKEKIYVSKKKIYCWERKK